MCERFKDVLKEYASTLILFMLFLAISVGIVFTIWNVYDGKPGILIIVLLIALLVFILIFVGVCIVSECTRCNLKNKKFNNAMIIEDLAKVLVLDEQEKDTLNRSLEGELDVTNERLFRYKRYIYCARSYDILLKSKELFSENHLRYAAEKLSKRTSNKISLINRFSIGIASFNGIFTIFLNLKFNQELMIIMVLIGLILGIGIVIQSMWEKMIINRPEGFYRSMIQKIIEKS